MNFVKSLSVLLALSLTATAAAQEGTPVFVQPPQTQTQTPQPPAQPTVPVLSPVQALPTPAAVLASAAPAPAPDGVTLWGGLSSELYILSGLTAGLSVPVFQTPALTVSVRGALDLVLVPLPDLPVAAAPLIGADLLLSTRSRGVNVYGGPGAGTLLGLVSWVGGTAGLRGTFSTDGRWGYFGEFKGRYFLDSDVGIFSPGARFGLTYRF
ncbi:hypothetical protein [Deinococcus sp. Leaf326]|uniref:hypothetical protein n=1 Tax=Deinococcus sp. Leaf326 TaxID=1736338 RepID=UPI0006FC4452|nr:hypothetical protein [Deinococcus sp. Leaf326]KQQ99360.1 hypothetical protein ASF71_13310 [Deinococcus sp. Leaf326]